MNIFKLITIILLITISITSRASGSLALAEELADVMNVKEIVVVNHSNKTIKGIQEIKKENFRFAIFSPSLNHQLKQYQQEVIRDLEVIYNSVDYKNEVYSLYVESFQETYTPEELKALISFYSTPIGQKVLNSQYNFKIESDELIADFIESNDNLENAKEVVHGLYLPMIFEDFEKLESENAKK